MNRVLKKFSIEQTWDYIYLAINAIKLGHFKKGRRFLNMSIEWCEGLEKNGER